MECRNNLVIATCMLPVIRIAVAQHFTCMGAPLFNMTTHESMLGLAGLIACRRWKENPLQQTAMPYRLKPRI